MSLNIDLKTLRNNFLSLLTLRLGNYIIPLIALPYLISVLGVEKFGLVAFAEMIIMYFKSIVDYGFDLTGTRSISENKKNKESVNKIVNVIFGVKFILSIVCFIILVALIFIFPKLNENALLFIFSYGVVLGNAMLPIWFFQGVEKMKYITIVNFLSRALYLILLFLFINNEENYYLVPLLNSSGLIFGGLVSIYIMKKKFNIRFSFPKVKDVVQCMKQDFDIFITTLAPNLYNNSMGVLLGVFTNNIQVGYFAAATKLIEVGNSFINIISTTIYPFLNRSKNYRKKLLNSTLLVGLCISIFFILFSDSLILILFGEEMKPSIIILQILSLSPLFISMMSVYGINTLILQKKDQLVRNIILIYSVLGLVLGVFFIKEYGILAAAIILVVIRGLIGVTELLVAKKLKV